MIGQANLVHGLYYIHEFISYLNESSYFVNIVLNCKESNVDIWHCKLGHPVHKIFEHVCKNFPYIHSTL